MVVIPVYLKHQISFREGIGGRLDITVGPKQTMGKVIENVTLEIPMPKSVLNVSLVANQGITPPYRGGGSNLLIWGIRILSVIMKHL